METAVKQSLHTIVAELNRLVHLTPSLCRKFTQDEVPEGTKVSIVQSNWGQSMKFTPSENLAPTKGQPWYLPMIEEGEWRTNTEITDFYYVEITTRNGTLCRASLFPVEVVPNVEARIQELKDALDKEVSRLESTGVKVSVFDTLILY